MKILYVAPKYDYGIMERGTSFEHANFFDSLRNMGNDILYFDYMVILKRIGKAKMNRLLVNLVNKEKPDLTFFFLYEYELDPRIVSAISRSNQTQTMNWFADDHWRFENFSRYWADKFNWVITTDSEAVEKYYRHGHKNVILSQWACNHFIYKNLSSQKDINVSFVGQAYSGREEVINSIRTAGIDVETRGLGWPAGRVGQSELIEFINRSRINLNLANASVKYVSNWINPIDRIALYQPGLRRIWRHLRSNLPFGLVKSQPITQIKGRNFEVPGCGGFLLTEYVNGIEDYYEPDQEVVCYSSKDEMIEKIKYYLVHDSERERIAQAGYKATLDKHTYVHRFNQIFRNLGLKDNFRLKLCPGSVVEIIDEL